MINLPANILELAMGDYAGIRQEYRARLYAEIVDYLTGGNLVSKRNAAKRAVSDAFNSAADLGYTDGGGDLKNRDPDFNDWVAGRMEKEFSNISVLFAQLSETRKDPEFQRIEANDIGNTRADGYAATLDSIYNEAKTRGAGNMMLTFGGQDGHSPGFPCRTCRKLKGQRHRASWWTKRGYIPYPGNENFDCGAWQCRHFLFTDDGKLFTV